MSGKLSILKPRRETRQIRLGSVAVGGKAPVSVQTMTKTDTRDVAATVEQIVRCAELGCDIVRLAVPDVEAAKAFAKIRRRSPVPLVADIHFDHRLALMALDSGADGLRINPGNIGGKANVREVVLAAQGRKVPIRVGVNSGSVEKDILHRHGGPVPEALVESAIRHVRLIENCGYRQIKISVKASDAVRTIAAYRLLSRKTRYPLHLGVTEAGTFLPGTASSSVALGILLAEGIGDTIRVSLTDRPEQEVRAGLAILRSLGLKPRGPSVISCPTCGRTQVDIVRLAGEVETAMEQLWAARPGRKCPVIAVMGCVVNGPGEAAHADIAVCGGRGRAALYLHGRHLRTVPERNVVTEIIKEARKWRK